MDGISILRMDQGHWEAMRHHVLCSLPEEACGILSGEGNLICEVFPVVNALHSSTRFRMDPEGQLAAMMKIEDVGQELIGIFHSHVLGPEHPSASDIGEAYDPGMIHLIWFAIDGDWHCRAYRLVENEPIEIPILVNPQ
jgi:proteasome lid subunit RPN8/RPN11